MHRRKLLKTIGIFGISTFSLKLFSNNVKTKLFNYVYILGRTDATKKYHDYCTSEYNADSKILVNAVDGPFYVSHKNFSFWKEKVDTIVANHYPDEKILIILCGCSNPEKIITNVIGKNVEIWVDRPLQLSRKEKSEISEDSKSFINIVHIDQSKAHFSSIG
ncbi:MAG TPA: hypothetical protein PLY70_13665 [Saprospiraceae bacterium]|nr:hypothetical protein [Saprospiraceae bacterium]HPN69420.1 hypothetical protein [Saprospiraceae bacterium]